MKKKLVIVLALVLLGGMSAQAQFKWGIKAGLNMSKVSFSGDAKDIYNAAVENATGFQVGPMVEFTVPIIGIGLDAAVMYSQVGMKLPSLGDNLSVAYKTLKANTLYIPVNLKYKLTFLDVVGVYGALGPYANFKLSDNLKNQWESKSFGAGLNFGIGVELLKHLQVGVNYQLGLTEDFSSLTLGSAANEAFKGKTRNWTVSAAYLF
jgi:hypothetical protein